MNNYEKICAIINAGHIAQVEYEDGKFEIFSCVTSEGYVRGSDTYGSSKDCYDALGTYLYSKKQLDDAIIKSISVYKRSLRYPKEGELVTILDTILDEPNREGYSIGYKEMIGGPYEVKHCDNLCELWNEDKSVCHYFDYRHLVPYLGEEIKTDDLSKGKEITLTVNGKEYKAIIQ